MNRNKIITAIEVAEQEEKELLARLNNHKQYINSLRQKLKLPETPINDPDQTTISLSETNGYNRNWTWTEKIAYFIQSEKRFLHVSEIQEMLAEKEPEMDNKILRKRVSSALARLKRDNNLITHKTGHTTHGVFWGSGKWLDENEKPKKEHMYKKEYLAENKSQKRFTF